MSDLRAEKFKQNIRHTMDDQFPIQDREKKRFKDWLLIALGWSLIVLGVLGLFLPFLQGALFIVLGVALLSRKSARARRWVKEIREKFQILRHKDKGDKSL